MGIRPNWHSSPCYARARMNRCAEPQSPASLVDCPGLVRYCSGAHGGPLMSQVVFAFDMVTKTDATHYKDFGSHGLHALDPGGANSPTPVSGGLSFNPNPSVQYLTLPLGFYTYAPPARWALLAIFEDAEVNGNNYRALFSCWNCISPPGDYGLLANMYRNDSITHRIEFYQFTHTAGWNYILEPAAAVQYVGQTGVVAVVREVPRVIRNCVTIDPGWAAGAYAAAVYDATIVPYIGRRADGTYGYYGTIKYLAMLDLSTLPGGDLSAADQSMLASVLLTGKKPWCY